MWGSFVGGVYFDQIVKDPKLSRLLTDRKIVTCIKEIFSEGYLLLHDCHIQVNLRGTR